jgi:hypothetical protein
MRAGPSSFMRLIFAATLASPSWADGPRWADDDHPVAREIVAVAQRWAKANCGPQPGLIAHFAEEFQGTAPDGKRYGRSRLQGFGQDRDCIVGDIKVQIFDGKTAVAYGTESSIRRRPDGSEWQRCLAWTDTWVHREGLWKIVAAQDTEVSCPSAAN